MKCFWKDAKMHTSSILIVSCFFSVEGSETDNISLRSETSFAVEMDNLVSMAELALSENSLELALKRNAAYLDPVGDLLMTSSSAKNRPLSSASLGDESTGGLLTPKAASPRYLVSTSYYYFPPTHNGGGKSLCCVFSKFCQNSVLLLHLVNSSHHSAVGTASAWQTRGRGFEPGPMRYIFSGKYPGA